MESFNIIQKAVDKVGLIRSKYENKNVPTNVTDVCVMVCWGDYRSLAILSSILLKRYREEIKGSKYFIFCSWGGLENLFPYVDEYWSVPSPVAAKVADKAFGFNNSSDLIVSTIRGLNYFFEDVITCDELLPYYENGITQEFWNIFKHVKKYLPSIPSANILGTEFIKELSRIPSKVFLYPSKHIYFYKNNKVEPLKTNKNFWICLCNRLKSEGYNPVIGSDYFTYDLSQDITDFAHFKIKTIEEMLVIMRHIGCVLDVFNGISRMAILARAPFISVDERGKYSSFKEYEIDGLIGKNIPKEYIYSFPTIINEESEKVLNVSIFDNIISKLNKLVPYISVVELPSTYELEEIVPYSEVKANKLKKIGIKFIKMKRD